MPRIPGSNVPDRPVGPSAEVVKRREELTSYPTRRNLLPHLPGLRLRGVHELVILDDQIEVYDPTAFEILKACREFNAFFAATPEEELWIYPTWYLTVASYNERLEREKIQAALLDVKLGEKRTGLDLLVDTRAANPNAFLAIHSSYAAGLAESENYRAADIGLPKDIDPRLRAFFVHQALAFPQITTCGLCPLYEVKDEPYHHTDIGFCNIAEVVGSGNVLPMEDKKVLFHHASLCVWVVAAALERKLTDQAWRERCGHYGSADYHRAVSDKLAQKALLRQLPANILARVLQLRRELPDVRLSNGAGRSVTVKNRMPLVAGKQQRDRKNAASFLPLEPLDLEAAGYARLRPTTEVHPPDAQLRDLSYLDDLPDIARADEIKKLRLSDPVVQRNISLSKLVAYLGAKYHYVF